MNAELQSLVQQRVFQVVERPPNVKVFPTRYVYKTKLNQYSQPVRNKSCIVVGGHLQQAGLDYQDISARTARYDTTRLLLAFAIQQGYGIRHYDITTAFLNAPLSPSDQVHVKPLPNFPTPPNHVWLLQKAMYGLHQAPKAWEGHITSLLTEPPLTFIQSKNDPSIFYYFVVHEASSDQPPPL